MFGQYASVWTLSWLSVVTRQGKNEEIGERLAQLRNYCSDWLQTWTGYSVCLMIKTSHGTKIIASFFHKLLIQWLTSDAPNNQEIFIIPAPNLEWTFLGRISKQPVKHLFKINSIIFKAESENTTIRQS